MKWIALALATVAAACAPRPSRLAGPALDSAAARRQCMAADSASRATIGCIVKDQRGTIVVH